MRFDLAAIRRQFPLLEANPGLAYFDGAATAQKPRAVIDACSSFLSRDNASVHRGMYPLAERATELYEGARAAIAKFIHAASPNEIVFTKSATEGINLVARTLGERWTEDDAVVLSPLEHHANVVPWLQLKERTGIDVRWMEMDDAGHLDLASLKKLLADKRVKLVGVTARSNVLGVRPPLKEIIVLARDAGALVLVDAAQSVAHEQTDVADLDCDVLVFSGHKLYGPTGIGVLYGKAKILESLPPFLGGGMMIQDVRPDGFTPADVPARFEAGTPPMAEAFGLRAAVEWISQYAWADIAAHEKQMVAALLQQLRSVKGVRILGPGTAEEAGNCVSITMDGVHPHDIAALLGKENVCIRAGHHCAQPLHRRLGIPASARFSVSIHTSMEDVERVGPALGNVRHTILG